MNAQIEGFLLQLTSVTQDVPGITRGLSDAQFTWQPASDRWSIAQVVEHLNLTTERYIPVLTRAITDARVDGRAADGPFALGFIERWFLGAMEPPPRRRFRTGRTFIPAGVLGRVTTLDRYAMLHNALAACIRSADGVDLGRVKVRSQFAPISWSLNGTFAILLAHERRHVWQAREVRNDPAFPS